MLTRISIAFAPWYAEFPQTSPEKVFLGELLQERSSGYSGRKLPSENSIVCKNVLRQVDKKALCSISVLKSEECQHQANFLSATVVITLSRLG